MKTYTDYCPCWHETYSREVGQYRRVTDPSCDLCGGVGYTEFVAFTAPRDVRVIRGAA